MKRILFLSAMFVTSIYQECSAEIIFGPDFASSYYATDLGMIPGLPLPYGDLTFIPGNRNRILIGGSAERPEGRLYTIDVTRDSEGHINGFSGSATLYGTNIGEFISAGVEFFNVLYTTRYGVNELGQTDWRAYPFPTDETTIIDLNPHIHNESFPISVSGLNFVPDVYVPDETLNREWLKMTSYPDGGWYSAQIVHNFDTNFPEVKNIRLVDLDLDTPGVQKLPGGSLALEHIHGFFFPIFGTNSILVGEYNTGTIAVYESDDNGNPLLATRRIFFAGLLRVVGIAIDHNTRDFLFATHSPDTETTRIVRVQLGTQPVEVPEPSSVALLVTGSVGLALYRRRR